MHKEFIGNTEFTFRMVPPGESLEPIYRLRYQVYCQECNFLKAEDYPDGIESDKYDQHSLHFVAETDFGPVGYARLVMNSALRYPLEEHYKKGDLKINLAEMDRKKLCEISRLIISKKMRRRVNDGLYYSPDLQIRLPETNTVTDDSSGRRMRPMVFGLYREMYQESKRRNFTTWISVMERTLCLLLRMHNIIFREIGEEFDYYGAVKPYIASLSEIESAFFKNAPLVNEYFLDGLEPKYHPKPGV